MIALTACMRDNWWYPICCHVLFGPIELRCLLRPSTISPSVHQHRTRIAINTMRPNSVDVRWHQFKPRAWVATGWMPRPRQSRDRGRNWGCNPEAWSSTVLVFDVTVFWTQPILQTFFSVVRRFTRIVLPVSHNHAFGCFFSKSLTAPIKPLFMYQDWILNRLHHFNRMMHRLGSTLSGLATVQAFIAYWQMALAKTNRRQVNSSMAAYIR